MILLLLAIVFGMAILLISADQFVNGAVGLAKKFNLSPLFIGMVIVGFGTSLPELVVSVMSVLGGSPNLIMGNAYGSNIINIGLILAITGLISPVIIQKNIIKQIFLLLIVSLIAVSQLFDLYVSRFNALVLLMLFIVATILTSKSGQSDLSDDDGVIDNSHSLGFIIVQILLGLIFLLISSKLLIWGAVGVAKGLGVSDLVIGLTIVAFGTSLPELISSIMAAKKGENQLALGNILGSNLFNTLVVVGVAGAIQGFPVEKILLIRDVPLMLFFTCSLFFINYQKKLTRWFSLFLLIIFFVYTIIVF